MGRNIVLVYPNAGQDVLGINVGLPLSILPGVRILNWLQDYYISSTHKKYQALRDRRLHEAACG